MKNYFSFILIAFFSMQLSATSLTNYTSAPIRMVNFYATKSGVKDSGTQIVDSGKTKHRIWVGINPNQQKEQNVEEEKNYEKFKTVQHKVLESFVEFVEEPVTFIIGLFCHSCVKKIEKTSTHWVEKPITIAENVTKNILVPRCVPFGDGEQTMYTGVQFKNKNKWYEICRYQDSFPPNAQSLYLWGRKGGNITTDKYSCDPVFVASTVKVAWEKTARGWDVCCTYAPPKNNKEQSLTIDPRAFPDFREPDQSAGFPHRCAGIALCKTEQCKKAQEQAQKASEEKSFVAEKGTDILLDGAIHLIESMME